MPITFHILDAFARDEKVVSETETEKVVEYEHEVEDDDEEFHSARYQKPQGKADHSNKSFIVHLFGKTVEGNPVRCDVKGFKPFFFIRAPDGPPSVQEAARTRVREYLSRHLYPEGIHRTVEVTRCERKELFGYTQQRKVPMLKLTMPSLGLFREVKNLFVNSSWEPQLKALRGRRDALGIPFTANEAPMVYEANLDPMLRFLHLRNLKPCNWATIGSLDYDDTMEDNGGQCECDWQDVDPCTSPPAATAPFSVVSWDIECMSKTGAFPMALKDDPIIQIGCIVSRLGSLEAEKHIFVFGTCDEIPEGTVHSYKTEKSMLLSWFRWINQLNPDIFIGYNIFGFDEKYVWERAIRLGLANKEEAIADEFRYFNKLSEEGEKMKLDEKRLSSSAMGDNFLYLWNTVGRLRVDLYHYIKRGYPLPSYKLDDTSRNFLGESVKGLEQKVDGWRFKIGATKQDVAVGRSIVFLNAGGDTLCEKVDVLAVEDGFLVAQIPDDVDAEEVAKWAVVKDDVTPKEMFKLHLGSSADRAIIARYCIQDCQLVLDLFRKLDVFNNSMSMANVCSVPVSYIFLRGQGIKIESLMFKYCYENEQCIVCLPAAKGDVETYEGAIVLDPTPGFYTAPVGVADFASLYPSTIISENISHDTLVWVKDFDADGKQLPVLNERGEFVRWNVWGNDSFDNLPGVAYTDIEYDNMIDDPEDTRKAKRKIKAGTRVCRYAQDRVGTIPQIVAGLLAARKAKRNEAAKESDPFKIALLDSEQLAYKLTANSLYGQLGSGTFKIRLRPLAASVTAYGRKQILFAKATIEMRYGPNSKNPNCCASADTVYGDSVAADTTLYHLRMNGFQMLPCEVKNLDSYLKDCFNLESSWVTCLDPGRQEKESFETPGLETLTEQGWTKVHRIIRHTLVPTKQMMRVMYGKDFHIDVTDDHSMVLMDGTSISPKLLKKGDALLSFTGSGAILDSIRSAGLIVKSIQSIEYTGYVYDLTTENHHFQAGPGNLVVHNTDSLFIAFNPKDPKTGKPLEGQEALKRTIELTEEAGKYVTLALKKPHDFEFDKVYWPFIIFSKKRYVGHKYEDPDDPNNYKLAFMGVALKRRDYAAIVKRMYSSALNVLLHERNVPKAAKIIQDMAVDLVEGKYGLQPLIISKSLKAEYANTPAHKMLADRMAARDPGNAPASGDRIPFVYIQPAPGQKAADLQGDRIETPAYIKEKGLKPDYMYYIDHQIANPVCQLFGVVVEQLPGFDSHPPPKNGWDENPDKLIVQKETVAYNLLFGPAMQVNTRNAKAAFVQMFGESVEVLDKPKRAPRQSTRAGVVKANPKQSTLDSMFMAVQQVEAAKKTVSAKKTAAKKKAQEEKVETASIHSVDV